MKTALISGLALYAVLSAGAANAQEAVVAAANPDALFTSPDSRLNANKQAAYHIIKDLLGAGHWEMADRWLTADYHQHNPLAASGRAGVVNFFTQILKVKPTPIPDRLSAPIAGVVAEGDYVVVAYVRPIAKPGGAAYTSTWFDMWRFKDGKADEHWDIATKDSPMP